jgi:hypothetical protein
MYRLVCLFVCFSCITVGCNKNNDEKPGDVPEIEFVSILPSTVKALQDTLVVRIAYRDGNGDLGENNSGVKNAFVKDLRNGLEYSFRIRQLAPDNSVISIKGELDIIIPALSSPLSGNTESASFQVYVKDRAGNKSNTILSSVITIEP